MGQGPRDSIAATLRASLSDTFLQVVNQCLECALWPHCFNKMGELLPRLTIADRAVDRLTSTLTPKPQALVYDILPSTTAVFSYAIGPRKLSANEQFFVGAQTSSKFVTNNSYVTRSHQISLLNETVVL